MNEKGQVAGGGVGFLGLLTLLFIGLKLSGHIDWSWWWVLSPIWIPIAFVIAIIVFMLVVALIVGIFSSEEES